MAGIPTEASIIDMVERAMPGRLQNVYAASPGGGKFLAVMQFKKSVPSDEGRQRQAALLAFSAFPELKQVILVDEDVDIFDMKDVMWAMTTRMDPVRDTVLVENTPIDYLDFASPVSGLGGKMGMDATNKWPGETTREWGRPISMPAEVLNRVEALLVP